jgi:phosphatidylinositol alpha 1,6-mannosyltransferase
MRVLYCTDTYPPQINGVSVVTALSVAGLTRRGWECAVIAPRYPGAMHAEWNGDTELGGNGEVLSLPSVPLPLYPEIRLAFAGRGMVGRMVERFRPALIHCETEFTVGRMGQRAAARWNIPLVSSYHTDFGRYTEAYGLPRLRRHVAAYLARFHRRSARVYTPSSVARRELQRLEVRDIEVWGRGVNATVFSPGRRSPEGRAKLGVGNRFTYVYVGRLAAEKQVHTVLEAYRRASHLLPGELHLVIAGTGPDESALRAAAPPGVDFLGFLDRPTQLPDLYANADAFVFASVTETLGLVVLEAMASGLPVIAAPVGGVTDHLRDCVNGLAYEAGNAEAMARAMVLLATDRQLTRQMSRAARRSAEALSWESELDRLDQSYREVLAGEVGKDARDGRPAPPLALGGHPAAVRLDQVLHDGEPEPGPALFA